MSKINDGGPAFPIQHSTIHNGKQITFPNEGMTLRDYFAAAALQGLLAYYGNFCDRDAKAAYAAADAMLEAKEAKP